jgi:hypothetical protein
VALSVGLLQILQAESGLVVLLESRAPEFSIDRQRKCQDPSLNSLVDAEWQPRTLLLRLSDY